MKKYLILLIPFLFFTTIHCGGEEEPYVCYLYGYTELIRVLNDSIPIYDTLPGIDGMVLRIYDINPYDVNLGRLRYDTTFTRDSIPGSFEMDSVCYGTSARQGNLVTIGISSTENQNYTTQYRSPDIFGDTDTVVVYLFE